MDYKVLKQLGLTEGESKVYLALLKLGTSTIGNIIKDAGVSNSKIYDILNRLAKKGLISTATKNGRKYFEAKDPSRLNEFMQLKEQEIDDQKQNLSKLMPQLEQIYKAEETEQEAEILYGLNGIKTFVELILNKLEKGDTFYILGAPKEASEALGPYFMDWHERRAKKGVNCRTLYNYDSKDRAEVMTNFPLTTVRILPKEIKTPVLIDIGKDHVATILFGQSPFCVLIKSKKIADSYISYFELMWKISQKV